MTETKSLAPVDWKYMNERVIAIPYFDGKTFPEDYLVGLYYRTKKDGLLHRMMPACVKEPSLADFVSYMHAHPPIIGVVRETLEIAGYGWLDEVQGRDGSRKASLGYGFFKKFWGTPVVRELSGLFIRWWFIEMKLEVLYGSMLKSNRLALKYAQEMGFTIVGELPRFFPREGSTEDGVLACVKREDFLLRDSTLPM